MVSDQGGEEVVRMSNCVSNQKLGTESRQSRKQKAKSSIPGINLVKYYISLYFYLFGYIIDFES